MAIVSSGALIDALRQYDLLTPEQLAELPHLLPGRCEDARKLAKMLGQRGWLTIYQINQLLLGRGKHLVYGPYCVLDILGQGGLSQVFKARHREHQWLVALKVLRPEALESDEGKQRFLQEMEAMARLDHPNIVQFCDVDQADDIFYFAMEFVEGTDLGKYVRLSGALPVGEACEYIYQTALGLQHAFERNLVHRDIKPVNLFLTHVQVPHTSDTGHQRGYPYNSSECKKPEPLIKILDWGLANLRTMMGRTQAQMMENMAKGIIGTADYLSPEQARSAETVDIRGDIYSLGCALYYLLACRPPFPNGSLMQKLIQHQQAQPQPIEELRGDVPAVIASILNRMLAKDPQDRFQTPAAVALALLPFVRSDRFLYSLSREQLAKLRGFTCNTIKDDTPLPLRLGGRPGTLSTRFPKVGRDALPDTSYPR